MKPLTLSFSNIRSYPQFGPVSFEGRSLVGILGDTGAGKSTVLEALCLALYGQASWQGSRHEDLMADGAPNMSVDLTFSHDGHTWRVQRTYYANARQTAASLRNVDTGLTVDNVRPVNAAIVTLLRMDFDAFKSAVLLPQGRFQTLLHASRTERAPLLKGIFGADRVDQIAALAGIRLEHLTDLQHQAELARAELPANPTADLRAAKAEARRHGKLVRTLEEGNARAEQLIDTARTDRETLGALKDAYARVTTAADHLAGSGTAERIAAASAAAREISDHAGQLGNRTEAARAGEEAAREALAVAERSGEGRSHIDAALAMLSDVPRRVDELTDLAEELDGDEHRFDAKAARINELRGSLTARQQTVGRLEAAAETADETARIAAASTRALRDAVVDALTSAAAVRAAMIRKREAEGGLDQLALTADSAEAKLREARAAEAAQEEELATTRRVAAASAVAVGLHPGDDCPVCNRGLQDDWHVPDPDAAARIGAAEQAVKTERAARERAERTLDRVNDQIESAGQARDIATDTIATTRAALATELERVGMAARALGDGLDPAGLADAVSLAADQAARLEPEAAAPRQVADELCIQAAAYTEDLRRAAASANRRAADARAELEADVKAVRDRDDALCQSRAQHVRSRERWRQSAETLTNQLRALPVPVGAPLPDIPVGELPDWLRHRDNGPLAAAALAAEKCSNRLARHEQDREVIRRELDELAAAEKALRDQLELEVAAPLRTASRVVAAAAAPLAEMADVLNSAGYAFPELRGSDNDPSAVGKYAQAAVDALAAAAAELEGQARLAQGRADMSLGEATTAWRAAVAAAADANDDAASGGEGASTDPEEALAANALTEVAVAIRLSRRRTRESEHDAEEAHRAITPAAALDDAITASRARTEALSGLRAALGRSKFPAHLVARRTEALLGLASDLFGRLSGGEFGFSDDFQIVVRRSGAVRDPKTLSGGETFLASLALALALVELYSRAGGRLGALFLDEGFGSLDLESLSAALDALAAETGGEKLVAVISHLHAVAEAVTDVLWVAKDLGSSTASWLAPAQVEALVSADAEAGLLA